MMTVGQLKRLLAQYSEDLPVQVNDNANGEILNIKAVDRFDAYPAFDDPECVMLQSFPEHE